MRPALAKWISDADANRLLHHFGVTRVPVGRAYVSSRADDYYLALIGELYDRMRAGYEDRTDWARLGNAFGLFAAETEDDTLRAIGVDRDEAALFAAVAFYTGGFPASAYLTMRDRRPAWTDQTRLACFDFLARPSRSISRIARSLVNALRRGDLNAIEAAQARATDVMNMALDRGPDEWIPARLLHQLITRFRITHIRGVLPDGGSDFWNPLISSLLDRTPPMWEFFPSQIAAIQQGLLEGSQTYSLQMPTGAGKTALCEILLYWHLKRSISDVAVVLVPYRSLAAELRTTLVRRLNAMSLPARCAYGGTVPSGAEVHALDETRAIVATPEALSGVLGADPNFFQRVTLVVCDEGHLLDAGERGVGLELLLARMRARKGSSLRFVFLSAIVPNIEEINAWLGGTPDSVVYSEYRPALAEFAVLRGSGSGAPASVALDMHAHEARPTRFSIPEFLSREDFQWTNPRTGRPNTYPYASVKTRAVAAARKALSMGTVALFAANKRGNQGAIGLTEELVEQLQRPLPLPAPIAFANSTRALAAVEYLELEYGPAWVGTQALAAGVVLHHGDIPQETREVLEALIRQGDIRLAICTNTLAEGVNFPIRTLVLYSLRRRTRGGRVEELLARDIKNLVGRAGRAGATTKGLVICANEHEWPIVERVARQTPGEPVTGALRLLLERLRGALARRNMTLADVDLEDIPALYTLIDGVDAMLIDLAAEEIGEEELIRLALQVADETFASRQADTVSRELLRDIFRLRARRVYDIRSTGQLGWVQETGARARMLKSVEDELLPRHGAWDDIQDPTNPSLVEAILEWAWTHRDLRESVRQTYRLDDTADIDSVRTSFFDSVAQWLSGERFAEMARRSNLTVDDMLGVHAQVLAFRLQTIVEQGVALLGKLIESQAGVLAPAVTHFPEHLRFGVPTAAARALVANGVRHRRAAVALGSLDALQVVTSEDRATLFSVAERLLLEDADAWRTQLGTLVFDNTLRDLGDSS